MPLVFDRIGGMGGLLADTKDVVSIRLLFHPNEVFMQVQLGPRNLLDAVIMVKVISKDEFFPRRVLDKQLVV